MPDFVTDDNVKLYYDDKGSGTAIVFLHGWSADRLSFNLPARKLSRNFRVITFDQRGHGSSSAPEYGLTLKRLATDLEQLMEYLQLQDVTLVGWSMGAQVLFEYINSFGCQRLQGCVVVDMTPKLINDPEWTLGLYHGHYSHTDNLKDLGLMCADWGAFVEHFLSHATPSLQPGTPHYKLSRQTLTANVPHVMYALWIAISAADYRESLHKITVPTLIMYGELSPLYSAETAHFLKAHIPDSRVVPFAKGSHLLIVEDPQLFINQLEHFVSSLI